MNKSKDVAPPQRCHGCGDEVDTGLSTTPPWTKRKCHKCGSIYCRDCFALLRLVIDLDVLDQESVAFCNPCVSVILMDYLQAEKKFAKSDPIPIPKIKVIECQNCCVEILPLGEKYDKWAYADMSFECSECKKLFCEECSDDPAVMLSFDPYWDDRKVRVCYNCAMEFMQKHCADKHEASFLLK